MRDVKELYERWTLGDGNGGEPATNAVLVTSGLPSGVSATQFNDNPATPQPYILFVHGWNMDPWEKDSFAETSFKRLYWQGYTNRFGSLRWPTTYGFSGSIVDIVTDPHNYDNGEFTAWRSGEGLRRHLVNLNQRYPGKTYVLAHSMGNVVAGEALALNAEKYSGGQIVNRYVASQAAVPIHCYSQNAPAGNFLNFQYTPTIFQITYPFANWDSGTGNVYPGWLSTNRASCAERVNFYNPNDFALAKDAWQFNQALKPDSGFTFSYLYLRFNSPQLPNLSGSIGSIPSHIIPSLARKGISPPLFRQLPGAFLYSGLLSSRFLDFEYDANAMYEVMAYASETRTLPLGALGETGVMERKFNLWDAWLGDPDPNNGNGIYARHKWHSAQFRSNYTTQNIYWANLLGKNGFVIFLDR